MGTSVIITGVSLSQASSVKFGTKSASFTVNSDTQVTATVPSGAKTGKIDITTAGGTASSSGTFTVTPAITSFIPTSGPVGTSVTITGTSFKAATSVKFNGRTSEGTPLGFPLALAWSRLMDLKPVVSVEILFGEFMGDFIVSRSDLLEINGFVRKDAIPRFAGFFT